MARRKSKSRYTKISMAYALIVKSASNLRKVKMILMTFALSTSTPKVKQTIKVKIGI